ncbi:MAG: helix-turn-helix domain-containing protein [Gallionellaceae bacterium]
MSILLMSRVFATGLQPSRKIVLLSLADFASDDGKNIFPSVGTIAKKSSLSHRSVQTILGDFLHSGILRVTKNPFGGAPGQTRHLEIDLAALENLMKLQRDEDFSSVQKRGANERSEGVQTDEKTTEAPAPKPSDIRHQTTTTDEIPDLSRGGETDVFDWPPQLNSEERETILNFFAKNPNSHQQQFVLDELRAALAKRAIPRRVAWVRAVLKNGVERTPEGKAYDRNRKYSGERKESLCHEPSNPKTMAEKNADRERLRKMREALKK